VFFDYLFWLLFFFFALSNIPTFPFRSISISFSFQGDDIVVFTDESRTEVKCTFFGLRQQSESDKAYSCLGDLIAPEGIPDYIGLFAVSAGIGADKLAKDFEAANDDYNSIMTKAIADR
jgi:5-methyltetrahydrofolate--homocysteine methyltransferase